MNLEHLTLNTGDTRASPRSEVGDGVVEFLQPLCKSGSYPVPATNGFRVQVTLGPGGGAVFTVDGPPVRGATLRAPLVTCGVVWSEDAASPVWASIEKLYFDISEAGGGVMMAAGSAASAMPSKLPWLAVVLLPGMPFYPDASDWLGDFERCLAWALIEKHK